ncbi:bifunctional folylpolyglutamate synthase/dihydrofolate synthase [Erythrobacter sp. EC-HK427]|uniref:bifunctional folylpolyglutamate synthase/dihydrofolate synthase n=1 Tax=Erythrobacter sp. EC-HK427 TaxID=2038396 RepID=UPI0012579861|nr:folylpolyglutamate synthase/dihydrofolate synthase family protein [Erythrobacter sp. EC-HK427]VVT12918.1 Folylpolyglutamate synthase [Erythrobacter sp. EC-HK427]
MKDFAISDDPAVQRQLDRLGELPLPTDKIGLETIETLLERLGNPQRALPPVFHVAGTNGKGSTCAFLRAMLEADGKRVHVHTKPHLVRYNERIRIGGELVSDAMLASLLEEVFDVAGDLPASFFEITTAAMFLAFHREPADACVIEVGLGGRFDATNVLESPAACGIAALGVDHADWLLQEDPTAPPPHPPLVRITFEKAGIARNGSPLVTQSYPPEVEQRIAESAAAAGAVLAMRGRDWFAETSPDGITYRDTRGELALPLPTLPGAHQADNAALAVAMLRHQDAVPVSDEALAAGIRAATWPARLQTLRPGPLTELAGERPVLLDGGHNEDAAGALARHLATLGAPVDAIIGMIKTKDARAFLRVIAPHVRSLTAVPVSGHDGVEPEEMAAMAREVRLTAEAALELTAAVEAQAGRSGTLLIAGSLYLAGEVLRLNREWPQ